MEPRRLPTSVITGMVVVGLGVGWLWWISAAPSRPAATVPVAVAGPVLPLPEQRSSAAEIWVPPAPARPVPPPQRYADEPVPQQTAYAFAEAIPPDRAGSDVSLDPQLVDWLLPAPGDQVLRDGVLLGPDAEWLVDGPATEGGYWLEVACYGLGQVDVEIVLAQSSARQLSVPCDTNVVTTELALSHGYAAFRFTPRAEANNLLVVAFQLIPPAG